ncbi:MAG: tRNA pseudouridine(55) synthase TruB [Firmicutes bacterium]|nr:tRNA pseudouridine(55) synthase TruB [Bacillota bacterium]
MDGLLLIDKPTGFTSHDIVNIARKSLSMKTIGHTGTLDPMATGVLVLCVGKATKLAKYFVNHDKTYIATILLGVQTDTDDITGKTIREIDSSQIQLDQVIQVLKTFTKKQLQIPPSYSAIKVGGKKLYEFARKEQKMPTVLPRDIEIYDISDIKGVNSSQNTFAFQATISCSKGTYIRALARDIGLKLGVVGTLSSLRRTKVGQFHIEDSFTVEDLKLQRTHLLDALPYLNMENLVLDDQNVKQVENGVFLPTNLFLKLEDTILYDSVNHPLAIYRYDSEKNVMRMSVKL